MSYLDIYNNEPLEHISKDEYEIIEIIGKGAFGTTYKAYDRKLDQIFAIKAIDLTITRLNGMKEENIMKEVETMKTLTQVGCKYISCYHDYYIIDEWVDPFAPDSKFVPSTKSRMLFIVMEYIDGIPIANIVTRDKHIHPNLLISIMTDLLKGLDFIHKNGFAHRDIKLDNIIIDKHTCHAKYIDFGLSCSTNCDAPAGAPLYRPPESKIFVPGLEAAQEHDIWSLGFLFFNLIHPKRNPIAIVNVESLIGRKREVSYDNILPAKYPFDDGINNIINYMLSESPPRPTPEYLLKLLLPISNIYTTCKLSTENIVGLSSLMKKYPGYKGGNMIEYYKDRCDSDLGVFSSPLLPICPQFIEK